MKKMTAFLLATVLILGLTGMTRAYEGEITFHGIPWGSSVNEAVRILNEKGLINPEWAEYADQVLASECGSYITKREEINAEISAGHSEVLALLQLDHGNLLLADDVRIAGYPVKRLKLTFIMDGEESRLANAGIDLEYDSASETIADLRQKLTTVYGNGIHAEVLHGIIATDCWTGTDGSVILLSVSESGANFTLDYGTLNAENMIEAALEGRTALTDHVDSTDVGGL